MRARSYAIVYRAVGLESVEWRMVTPSVLVLAIDESVGQLAGAHREVGRMSQVVRHDGSHGIDLPPPGARRIHLVAVAAGGKRRVPFAGGSAEGGHYVHAMEAEALNEIVDAQADRLQVICGKNNQALGRMLYVGKRDVLCNRRQERAPTA